MLQYRGVSIAVFAAVSFTPCFGQVPATFQEQNQQLSTPGYFGVNTYAVDLNNDGLPDIVETLFSPYTAPPPGGFQVFLAKGDGSFTPGFVYDAAYVSATSIGNCNSLAMGDFNGDGNADLIYPLFASGRVVVFLGKGDGTFESPVEETVAPAGWTISGCGITASDFNRDGKLDLVLPLSNTVALSPTSMLAFLAGKGDGSFGTAAMITAGIADPQQIETGDFNGDAIADIAYTENVNCNNGSCGTVVHVLYGYGNATFLDTTPLHASNSITIGTGDLNSDGRTDIITIMNSGSQLATLYGQQDRTFALYTQEVDQSTTLINNGIGFKVADFDGDGRMDFVTVSTNNSTLQQFRFFLGTSSPGAFTQQTVDVPGYFLTYSNPAVGNFVSEPWGRPSALFSGAWEPSASTPAGPVPYFFEARNTTNGGFWGGCAFPHSARGFHLCSSTTGKAGTQFVVDASANSLGNLRMIDLWVDGRKVAEQFHAWGNRAWFDWGGYFTGGTHNASLVAVDTDNRYFVSNFTFTISQ